MSTEEKRDEATTLDYFLIAGLFLPAIPLVLLWARHGVLDSSTPPNIRSWIIGLVILMSICTFWLERRSDSYNWARFLFFIVPLAAINLIFNLHLGQKISEEFFGPGAHSVNVFLVIILFYALGHAGLAIGAIGEFLTDPLKSRVKDAWSKGNYAKVGLLGIILVAIYLVFLLFELIA